MDLSNQLTTLTKNEYRNAAFQLKLGNYPGYEGVKVPYGKAKEILGISYWAPNGDAVTDPADGEEYKITASGRGRPKAVPRSTHRANKRRQAATRTAAMAFDQEALKFLQDAEVNGRMLNGGSVEDFFEQRKIDEKEYLSTVKDWENKTGIPLDDGHMVGRDVNSPDARAPEIRRINQDKRQTKGISLAEMDRAGLPSSDMMEAVNYVAGNGFQGTNAPLGVQERAAMLNQGIPADQAVAQADQRMSRAAQMAAMASDPMEFPPTMGITLSAISNALAPTSRTADTGLLEAPHIFLP